MTKLPGGAKLKGTFRCGKNVLKIAATVRGPAMHGTSQLRARTRSFRATRASSPGVELRGATGARAVSAIPNVFRPERQSAQFLSKLGRVLVARREVLVGLGPNAGDPNVASAGGGGLSSFTPHFVTRASVHYQLTGTPPATRRARRRCSS